METANGLKSLGASNIINLISSVNTLIENLSEPADDDAASNLIDRSAADINRQLALLEKLFARQKRQRRSGNERNRRRQQSVAAPQGACSRSPCSNCTASNCNAESSSKRLGRRSEGRSQRRYHSASASSSPDSSSSSCLARQTLEIDGVGQLASNDEMKESNSCLNHNKHRTVVQRRLELKTECIDFGYLKAGLQTGSSPESKQLGCGDRVAQLEHMIQKLQNEVANLKLKCERQLCADVKGCGLSPRLKGDIRRVQACVSNLYIELQQELGVRRPSKAEGCRHFGSATKLTRDPMRDLKCKYERSLLYNRFDVNWPFLHIIAPRPVSIEPDPCDETD